MSKALEVAGLAKYYGSITAVDGISFTVGAGEIVGLLGPNGAGKTTTINMVLSVLAPSAGSVVIEGLDLAKQRSQALARTNFAAVYAPLPGNLTVAQNLRVFGLLYGVKNLSARIDELITQFDLERFRDAKCGVLSSGEQTRVCLAKAMLNRPTLLLLDEPTASLDPATARDIRAQVRGVVKSNIGVAHSDNALGRAKSEDFREPARNVRSEYVSTGSAENQAFFRPSSISGVGVLWTSHNMNEVEEVCDRVLFMSKGKILLEGNPKTLPREHGKATLEELFITVAREPLTLTG